MNECMTALRGGASRQRFRAVLQGNTVWRRCIEDFLAFFFKL
jgi:hypothetical protein